MNNNEFPFNHFFSQNISSKPKENNGFSKRQSIKSLNTDSHKFPSPQLKPESQYSSKDLELLSSEIKNFLKSNISPLKYSLYFQKTFTVSRITEKEV